MPKIPEHVVRDLPQERLHHLIEIARRAELELTVTDAGANLSGSKIMARGALISVIPLQDDSGAVLESATDILNADPGLVSEEEGSRIVGEALNRLSESKSDIHLVTNVQELAFELYRAEDPAEELRKFAATNESVRFYRILASETFHLRDMLWRIVTAAIESGTGLAQAISIGRFPESTAQNGLSNWPSEMIAVPLAARLQPMALSVMTRRGAHVVGAFEHGLPIRRALVSTWPVSSQTFVMRGFGRGVYNTRFNTIPPDWPAAIQSALLVGSNVLADIVTNPDEWVDDDGYIDIYERNILVANLATGVTALAETAEEWGTSTNMWSAYRALSVLSGVWRDKGSDGKRLALHQLLNPETIRAVALPRLRPESYRQWAEDVVDQYQRELTTTMYPGRSLGEALKLLEHTRHLIHGAGAVPSARRYERMRALLGASKGSVPTADIANFWWTALIMDPIGMSIKGPAPFPGVND